MSEINELKDLIIGFQSAVMKELKTLNQKIDSLQAEVNDVSKSVNLLINRTMENEKEIRAMKKSAR